MDVVVALFALVAEAVVVVVDTGFYYFDIFHEIVLSSMNF
jgi:hypothetical protein